MKDKVARSSCPIPLPAGRASKHAKTFFPIIFLIAALSCLILIPKALAHSPLPPGDNESLDTATFVPDPTKSWAIYGELHEGGEAHYYRFNMTAGQRIHVGLLKSTHPEDTAFLPGFVLMGPAIDSEGEAPGYVEVPVGADILVVEGEQPAQATYEPFSPGSFYSLAEVSLDAPSSGTYYVAVFEPSHGGHYGLAIGYREAYTLSEWVLIPINLISVYQWDRQSLILIFLPMAVVLAVGLGTMIWRLRNRRASRRLFSWVGTVGGLLFLGSSATILFQMVLALTHAAVGPEIVVTLVLALVPILLGIGVLRLVLRPEGTVPTKSRVYLVILGLVALFAWAGLLVGPVLVMVSGVLPAGAGVSAEGRNSEK